MLSKSCIYGILAALYIANVKDKSYVPIHDIAEKLNLSFHFLTKILQKLTHQDIMISFRGPNGGVSLARDPDSIYLIEIVNAIDGPKIFEQCILGLPGCGDHPPCPLHDEWKPTRERIQFIFENANLTDLSSKFKEFNLRLTQDGH